MDRRKKGKKKNKSHHQNRSPEEEEKSEEKPQGLDTTGLDETLASRFSDADDLIQAHYTRIAKQENLLVAAKDQATSEIDLCFDKLQQILNRRRQLLKSEIKDVYEGCLEDIVQKKENVVVSGMMLETLLKQARDMSSQNSEPVVGFQDMVRIEIEKHCQCAMSETLGKNFLEFDKKAEVFENSQRILRTVGRIRSEKFLPSLVSVDDCKAIVGLQSELVLNIIDIQGKSIPPSFIDNNQVSFQFKDSIGEFVHHRISTSEDGKVTFQFRPGSQSNHKLEVFFLGCLLKELEILIEGNIPVSVLGAEAGLVQPSALCTINDERLCVADVGDSKLLLFSSTGVLQAETFFPDGNFIPFDVTYSPESDLIICTGSYIDDQEDTLSASPDGATDGAFGLEQDDAIKNLDRDITPSKFETCEVSVSSKLIGAEACVPQNDECLRMFETAILNIKVLCIEKRGYVAINQHNMVILSDPNTNCVSIYTIDGQFLRVVYAPEMDCPGNVECRNKSDDRIVVADIGKSALWSGYMEKGLKEQWGSVETESKHLVLPIAVAMDEEGNLFVADGAGPRVFIYGEWGEFISVVELSRGGKCSKEYKHKATNVSPWALTVLNGMIWLIDNNSHQLLRYQYSMPI